MSTSPDPTTPGLRRIWLAFPAVLAYASDIALTLLGQPRVYWVDHDEALELNPVALPLMKFSPWLFIGLACVWGIFLGAVITLWKRAFVAWAAVYMTLTHVVGACSWLGQFGFWGEVAGGVYIVAITLFIRWSWRRAGWIVDR